MADQDDHSWCDQLHDGEIVPVSATWRGQLFRNPLIGMGAELTWAIDVRCREVVRDCGDSPVSLAVEWFSLDVPSWREAAGATVTCDRFAEPVESSVYFFEHYSFERVRLHAVSQKDLTTRFAIEISGDLDGLGVDHVTLAVDAEFTGIVVYEDCPPLERFTDPAGLVGSAEPGADHVWYTPVSHG